MTSVGEHYPLTPYVTQGASEGTPRYHRGRIPAFARPFRTLWHEQIPTVFTIERSMPGDEQYRGILRSCLAKELRQCGFDVRFGGSLVSVLRQQERLDVAIERLPLSSQYIAEPTCILSRKFQVTCLIELCAANGRKMWVLVDPN